MRCINCGEEIPGGLEICPFCGAEQPKGGKGESSEGAPEEGSENSGQESGSADRPRKNKKLAVAVGAGCVVLAALIAVTLYSGDGGNSSGSAGTDVQTENSAASEETKTPEDQSQADELSPSKESETKEEAGPIEETKAAEEENSEEEAKSEEQKKPEMPKKPQTESEDTHPSYIPDSALYYEGHHYYIYTDVKTNWDDVVDRCIERGGYPAVINSKSENEKLYRYMTDMGFEQAFFGLVYDEDLEQWIYRLGDSSDLRDWGKNSRGEKEPNNSGGSEYNVELDINMLDGYWNDAEFGAQVYTPDGEKYKDCYSYICEWDN